MVDAIAALGDKDDLTDENYTDKTEALTAAEKLYNDFVRLYGEEDSAKLITNAQALTDYRTAYNAAEEAAKAKAKQAAIQNVEDLIEAIGAVNEDNYTEKEALIVAAETALRELQATYGDEAANEVRNKGDLEEAREKYDEIVAEAGGNLRRYQRGHKDRRERRADGAAAQRADQDAGGRRAGGGGRQQRRQGGRERRAADPAALGEPHRSLPGRGISNFYYERQTPLCQDGTGAFLVRGRY